MNKLTTAFLLQCKENFFKGITPANANQKDKKEYQTLVKIALRYFDEGKEEEFTNFLMEGQYLVALWAAHLLLDFQNITDCNYNSEALDIIRQYSENPLAPEVAAEEKEWLLNNKDRFSC